VRRGLPSLRSRRFIAEFAASLRDLFGRYHVRALCTPREVRNALAYAHERAQALAPAERIAPPVRPGRCVVGDVVRRMGAAATGKRAAQTASGCAASVLADDEGVAPSRADRSGRDAGL